MTAHSKLPKKALWLFCFYFGAIQPRILKYYLLLPQKLIDIAPGKMDGTLRLMFSLTNMALISGGTFVDILGGVKSILVAQLSGDSWMYPDPNVPLWEIPI